MMNDTRRSSSKQHCRQQQNDNNTNTRRRILPPSYGGASTILQEVHLVSPRRETRPRSGSDSSSSSPTSTMDVPQSSSSSVFLIPSFTKSPGLRSKKVDPLALSNCATPLLTITKELSCSKTYSSMETCTEIPGRSTNIFGENKNTRSFRKSNSVPIECRSQSPHVDEGRRRSIFETYWKSEKSIFSCHPPPPPPIDAADDASAATVDDSAALHLAPWLPAVPTPLVRMHSHCGLYPLVTPRSILRKTKSLGNALGPKTRDLSAVPFNLTQSMRLPSQSRPSQDTQTNYDCMDSQQHPRSVHFDPRVVVTELADAEPRLWYTDQELQTFQAETVLVARAYLHSHPQLIPLYSQPVKNAVTGGMRKRALFSLEIFRNVGEGEPTTGTIKTIVQRIRIVDPHPATLALLRRSFTALFPEATIDCSCGDERSEGLVQQQQQLAPRWDILVLDSTVLRSPPSCSNDTLVIRLRHRTASAKTTNTDDNAFASTFDITWDKPIPSLTTELRQSLLHALEEKRNPP